MLDNLRNFGRSWVAKILIGFLIIAVAGFGLPSIFLDLGANTVARVGDQNIQAREFDRLYRAQLNQFAQQTGTAPTAEQSLAFGLPNAVLARLANDAAVEILARRLDLGASDARLAQMVRQDPSFANSFGLFGAGEFAQMLRQAGYTEAEYLNLQRKAASREQIGTILDRAHMPQMGLDLARAYDNDQRTLEYIELSPVLFAVADDPSEEALARFFEENLSRFRLPETRVATLLPLTAEALAQGMTLSEADIAAEYERTSGQYVAPERRTIHQLVLPDDATAQLFADGSDQGRSFAALVSEAGLQLEVETLGTLSEAEISDPQLAATAFALDANGFGLIGTERAVWVSAIAEGGPQPLEAVRDEVEQTARQRLAQDRLFSVYDEIEEARAAFLPIADVAERHGLAVHEIELTRDGAALAGIDTLPSGSEQTVVNAVFAASPDAPITPAVNLGSNRTLFFTLDEVRPERDRTLDEVREEAVAAWRDLETEMAMTRAAEDMVAALDQGSDIFSLAAAQGQIPQASAPFSRATASQAIDPDLAQAAFQGGEGHGGYVTTQTGDVVVFQVTEVIETQGDAPSQIADALEEGFADLLYAGFVEGLRQDQDIRVNEATLNRLIGLE